MESCLSTQPQEHMSCGSVALCEAMRQKRGFVGTLEVFLRKCTKATWRDWR